MMSTEKNNGWLDAVHDAMDEAGNMARLARLIGTDRRVLHNALKRKKLSARLAIMISRKTSVPLERLVPDLFMD